MDDKNKTESSTPDTPKSSNGKEKSWKPRHKKKKGGNMATVISSSYTSSTEEIKAHIFTTGPAMNKTFLISRGEFLGYATTKFGNDVTYSYNKRRVAIMHTRAPTAIDYSTTSLYEQCQHEVEAKEFRAEFRKLQNDLRKLYGILWDQCDSVMKNKIQSDVDYAEVSKMLNVLGLLTIIERICLSNDTSKYYALQGFICREEAAEFRTDQWNVPSRLP